jgi:copper homeostasis protein
MVRQAAGRIEIMAGGGVTPEAVPDLCTAGVDAIHASCGVPTEPASILARIGLAPVRNETSAERIAALRAKLDERVAA